jgi:hypothetical protein
MKKNIRIVLFIVLCTSTLPRSYAEGKSSAAFHIWVEPLCGVRWGSLGEYVYAPDYTGSYVKLSYLQWEEKPVWYYGGKIGASLKNITLTGYATGTVPAACGSMKDSDWQNYYYGDTSTKTNYSISDNELVSGIQAGGVLSYSFHPSMNLSVSPVVSFDFDYTSMSAANGTGWYGNEQGSGYAAWDSTNRTIYDFTGETVCSYRRYTYTGWLGCKASYTFSNRWQFGLSGSVSPYMYMYSFDHHFLNTETGDGTYYMDIMSGWFSGIKGEVHTQFTVTPWCFFLFSVSGTACGPIYGKDYYSYTNDGSWTLVQDCKAAADAVYCQAAASIKMVW